MDEAKLFQLEQEHDANAERAAFGLSIILICLLALGCGLFAWAAQ
jgi:hypothetical protein